MKFIFVFILAILVFGSFASAADEATPRITPLVDNNPLEKRAGQCPSGTFACNDSQGGCCSYGTTCAPNYSCVGVGSGGGSSYGSGSSYSGGSSTLKSSLTIVPLVFSILQFF
jgi:hypothetical protein